MSRSRARWSLLVKSRPVVGGLLGFLLPKSIRVSIVVVAPQHLTDFAAERIVRFGLCGERHTSQCSPPLSISASKRSS